MSSLEFPNESVPDPLERIEKERLDDGDARWELIRRRHTLLGYGFVVLAAMLAGVMFFGFFVVARNNSLLAGIAGMQPAMDALNAKVQDLARKEKDNDTLVTALLMDEQELRDHTPGAARTRRDVSARADLGAGNKPPSERIGFEVSKGHSTQLEPGISLGLTKTDVVSHRADGWMWVMPDRRTIWLRGQGAQEPLTFYGSSDGRRRELVITQVTRNSVAGYLLLSKDREKGPAPPSERNP